MHPNEITAEIIERAIHIHRQLGPGLLESVYSRILIHELRKSGRSVEHEVAIPVMWDGMQIELGFRADLIVYDLVIVEVKSVEATHPVHSKQLLTYLKLTNKRVGLLINFNVALLKDGITRVVNGLVE